MTTHFVAEWARGHGLARGLVAAVEEAARKAGFYFLNLDVRETQGAGDQAVRGHGLQPGAPTALRDRARPGIAGLSSTRTHVLRPVRCRSAPYRSSAMILYPAIDLKDGQCVRLVHGDMDKATVFNTSPADQASDSPRRLRLAATWSTSTAHRGKPVNAAAVRSDPARRSPCPCSSAAASAT